MFFKWSPIANPSDRLDAPGGTRRGAGRARASSPRLRRSAAAEVHVDEVAGGPAWPVVGPARADRVAARHRARARAVGGLAEVARRPGNERIFGEATKIFRVCKTLLIQLGVTAASCAGYRKLGNGGKPAGAAMGATLAL